MKLSTFIPLATLMYAVSADDHGDNETHPAVNCRNDICYSAVVLESTASSGSGPVYFQIYAPDTFSWVGLGTGTSMADSNIFLIYQDGEGNVTLSNRQTSGHTMPQVPSDGGAELTLLGGSGVSDGFMVANFRCDNCESWKGSESADFSGEVPMIGAWREGPSLDSTDVEEQISQHSGNPRIFSLDLSSAQVAERGNPFVGDLAVPEESANDTSGGDAEDAGVGRSALLSGSGALVILSMALSLGEFLLFLYPQACC